MPDTMLTDLEQMYNRLKVHRSNWDFLWQEIADYMVPWRNRITNYVQPGTKLTDRIFDSTAPEALTTAASAVHGSITPSTLRWIGFTLNDQELLNQDGVSGWLDDLADRVFGAVSQSNFDSEAQELYSDLLAFGTGAMVVEEEEPRAGVPFTGIRCHTQQPGSFVIGEGPDGRVDTIIREFPLSVNAMVKRWGLEKLSEGAQRLYTDGHGDEMYMIGHFITPRRGGSKNAKAAPRRQAIMSNWVELGPGLMISQAQSLKLHLLAEDGRPEMNVMIPRWRKMSGEIYGRSPGMNVLPDVRTLNKAVELRLKAWTLAVAPPVVTSDRGVIGNIRLEPFGRTYKRPGAEIDFLELPARFDVANFSEEQLRGVIRQGFFVDLLQFQAKPGTPISATEASIRFQTMQRILGPVVSRLQSEFLMPFVARVVNIMNRRGALPAPPPSLDGSDAQVQLVFEGPLSRVQRAGDVDSINQFMSLIFPMAEANKRVLNRIDFDEVVETLAHATSLPARLLKTRGQADAIEKAEAEQAQQQMAMQNLIGAADVLQRGQSRGAQ